MLFQSEIKDFMCRELIWVESDDELEEQIKISPHNKVFMMKEKEVTAITWIRNKPDFATCPTIPVNTDFKEIISLFREHGTILIKEKEKIAGFIDPVVLLKKLSRKNEEIQAYFQAVLDTADTSCTAVDKNESVLIWTEGAEEIFSVKEEEIIGRPITDFFSTDRLKLLKTLKDGTSVRNSQHQAREDLIVLINSQPVYLDDDIIGAVVAETDITSQVRLNNQLHSATEKVFHLEKEVNKLKPSNNPFELIRGNSETLKRTIDITTKAATTETNILIYGESGVGKELFAKAVHHLREDENAPFVAINCGAIPESLFESEIFGYEKGAFSGANQKGKKGKAELAKGGTLFLDEIGEMPLEMQVKILRLLQERKFYRVGGTTEIELDFRVVAATNRDLMEQVKEGKFREDLYYRLNVVSLEIPSLRKRPEDIIELTHYFIYEISIKYNRPIHGITQEVMQAMLHHDWPGNVRELRNVVERLVVFSDNGEMKMEDLPFEVDGMDLSKGKKTPFPLNENDERPLSERLQVFERDIIIKELQKENGNKLSCAKNLQVTRATLYNRMHKLGIDINQPV